MVLSRITAEAVPATNTQEAFLPGRPCFLHVDPSLQELKYGDGLQLARSRELDECFAQANDQMEITDSLIREMRQMGQPCDAYQKRYCPGSRAQAGLAKESVARSVTPHPACMTSSEDTDIPRERPSYLVFCSFMYLEHLRTKTTPFVFWGYHEAVGRKIEQATPKEWAYCEELSLLRAINCPSLEGNSKGLWHSI